MLGPWPRAGAVPSTHRDLEGMQRGTKRAWRLWRLLPGRAACVGADVSTSPGDTSVSRVPLPPPPRPGPTSSPGPGAQQALTAPIAPPGGWAPLPGAFRASQGASCQSGGHRGACGGHAATPRTQEVVLCIPGFSAPSRSWN